MIDLAITIVQAGAAFHDIYKCASTLMGGNKQEQYLRQITADVRDTKVHIEQLSDNILYAVNLDSVRDTEQKEQRYINELREVRQMLEPLQRAITQPILSSAMISAPQQIVSNNPRQLLRDISPLEYVIRPVVDDWMPILFEDNGRHWVGWQSPAQLSKLGCEYLSQWQPNKNVLPLSQLSKSNKLNLATLFPAKTGEKIQQQGRYIDNDDGTVTDSRTGLIWLEKPDCFGKQSWEFAKQTVAKLAHGQCGLRDNSKAGDWRLPTKDEWETTITENKYRKSALYAFSGVQSRDYWSSSTDKHSGSAWAIGLSFGVVLKVGKTDTIYVWPVRGKQQQFSADKNGTIFQSITTKAKKYFSG